MSIVFFYIISTTATYSQTVYNKIIQQKTIVIGISQNYPPLNIPGSNGERSGVEMEMIKSLAEFLGVKPVLVPLSVNEYVKSLEGGKVDLIIAGMSRNLERSGKIWFSDPYLTVYPAALVDNRLIRTTKFGQDIEESPVVNLRDLNKSGKLSFIVKDGSIYEYIVQYEFHSNNFVKVLNNEDGLKLLNDFKANAYLHDSLYLDYLLKDHTGLNKSFTLMRAMNRDEYLCVGIPFGDIILKNQVNVWIAELIRTGTLNHWLNKYLSHETDK